VFDELIFGFAIRPSARLLINAQTVPEAVIKFSSESIFVRRDS
jgi:hypothetical protein